VLFLQEGTGEVACAATNRRPRPRRGSPASCRLGLRSHRAILTPACRCPKIRTMKTLVIYSSKHHMNTEKIAAAIGVELGAEAKKLADVRPQDLDGVDLVGCGSGVEGFNVHPELTAFVTGLSERKGQRAFVFTTCASNKDWTEKLRALLAGKGFAVVGEFHCPGLWTPLFFKVRRGHPDATDIESA